MCPVESRTILQLLLYLFLNTFQFLEEVFLSHFRGIVGKMDSQCTLLRHFRPKGEEVSLEREPIHVASVFV